MKWHSMPLLLLIINALTVLCVKNHARYVMKPSRAMEIDRFPITHIQWPRWNGTTAGDVFACISSEPW